MTARQPRRTRRRTPPGATLPRPTSAAADDQAADAASAASRARRPIRHRQHHVTTDYSHVKRDLTSILVIGVVVLAFIFGMSFVL